MSSIDHRKTGPRVKRKHYKIRRRTGTPTPKLINKNEKRRYLREKKNKKEGIISIQKAILNNYGDPVSHEEKMAF